MASYLETIGGIIDFVNSLNLDIEVAWNLGCLDQRSVFKYKLATLDNLGHLVAI